MDSNAQPSVSSLKAQWDDVTVKYNCLNAIGEFDFTMPRHAISTALPAASVFIEKVGLIPRPLWEC